MPRLLSGGVFLRIVPCDTRQVPPWIRGTVTKRLRGMPAGLRGMTSIVPSTRRRVEALGKKRLCHNFAAMAQSRDCCCVFLSKLLHLIKDAALL